MNGYELSRRYWDWAFRQPEHRTPTHAALYHWYIEWCNRLGWPDKFEMAPQYAMTAIGVSSYNTYKKIFQELARFGFIHIIREGKNQYAPCVLALSKIDEALNEALDTAPSKRKPNALSSGLSNFDRPSDKPRDKPRGALS